MMKLWQKTTQVATQVEDFTVGKDREMDAYLAAFDVLGSLAHTRMLASVGLMSEADLAQVQLGLKAIYAEIQAGNFRIEEGVEDVHSQVELLLTQRIGEAGKRIHAGRSRNDQVLVDLKLFFRDQIEHLVASTEKVFATLQRLSEQHQGVLLPGYTHLQVAMPSSFGLWLGAYAEALVDDMQMVLAAWKIANRNPLGSAAGYGSSFPLNRTMTTELLGFDSLNYNVVYAQMGRGKTERILAQAMGALAATLGRLAMDITLYMNQNFGFLTLPEHLTTGSSIMPHKKNPDVLELVRAHCNKLQALPNEIALMTTNLPSGYFRDMQLLKESLFPAFKTLNDCMEMTVLMLENMQVNPHILDDPKYDYLFSVEVVNKLVLAGTPFREAYKQVGLAIENGTYQPAKTVVHTHEGSIGNLQTQAIAALFAKVRSEFGFEEVHRALNQLIAE